MNAITATKRRVLMIWNRYFGKKGSQYDFKANDINGLNDKRRELEEQQKGMKKKINPKVLNMIDRFVVPKSGIILHRAY